jgi:hypothetical protein
MKRALFVAALLVATPAEAAMWTEVSHHVTFEPTKLFSYEIDIESIVERNGWTYASTRVLSGLHTDPGGLTSTDITTSHFHCKEERIKWLGGTLKMRKPNGEWWSAYDIQKGTRYWLTSWTEARQKAHLVRWDRTMTAAFTFICNGY